MECRTEIRVVPGFENYRISNDGRVWSVDRLEQCNGTNRRRKGREMRPKADNAGHLRVTMTVNNERFHWQVARLVALAFLEGYDSRLDVVHRDGDKANCRIENLVQMSRRQCGMIGAKTAGDKRVPEHSSTLGEQEWHAVPRHPDYEICQAGRVRIVGGGWLLAHRVSSRRVTVRLSTGGVAAAVAVPRLMGIVFRGVDYECRSIGRVDGDHSNCALGNLVFPS